MSKIRGRYRQEDLLNRLFFLIAFVVTKLYGPNVMQHVILYCKSALFCHFGTNESKKGCVHLLGVFPHVVRVKDSAIGRIKVPKADEEVSALVAAISLLSCELSLPRFLCSEQ